jgi:hypothetical protein
MISIAETHLTGHIRTHAQPPLDSQILAARWMVSPEQAHQTLLCTTQKGVKDCLHPSIEGRFPTNDRMLLYKWLPHPLFTDTMFAGTQSVGGNKCSQVYTTSFGWCKAHNMKCKGKAHKTLLLLFARDGVPPTMIADNSKEHGRQIAT